MRHSDSARIGQARASEPLNVRSRSESAPQQANRSSKITISLDRRCNSRRVYALTRSRNKSWSRTQFQTYASAKGCYSKNSAKLSSKVSVPQSAPMLPRGGRRIRRSNSRFLKGIFVRRRPLSTFVAWTGNRIGGTGQKWTATDAITNPIFPASAFFERSPNGAPNYFRFRVSLCEFRN